MYCHWRVFKMGIPTGANVRFSMHCQCLFPTASLSLTLTRHRLGQSMGGALGAATQKPPKGVHTECTCIGKYVHIYYKIGPSKVVKIRLLTL